MQGLFDRDPTDDGPTDDDPTGDGLTGAGPTGDGLTGAGPTGDGLTGAGPTGDDPTGDLDDDDPLLGLEPLPQRMHGDIPIRGYVRGEPIPNLRVLPRDRWREVLTPLSPYTRQFAKGTVGSIADAMAVNALVGELSISAPAPSLDAAPPPLPRAAADPPLRGPRRQVNFRLSPGEHARLTQLARAFGMRPGPLARLLTVRGVERALYEERRDG